MLFRRRVRVNNVVINLHRSRIPIIEAFPLQLVEDLSDAFTGTGSRYFVFNKD